MSWSFPSLLEKGQRSVVRKEGMNGEMYPVEPRIFHLEIPTHWLGKRPPAERLGRSTLLWAQTVGLWLIGWSLYISLGGRKGTMVRRQFVYHSTTSYLWPKYNFSDVSKRFKCRNFPTVVLVTTENLEHPKYTYSGLVKLIQVYPKDIMLCVMQTGR